LDFSSSTLNAVFAAGFRQASNPVPALAPSKSALPAPAELKKNLKSFLELFPNISEDRKVECSVCWET
jgi:hypothetical protein